MQVVNAILFSTYKHNHTGKYGIGCTPIGYVPAEWISRCFGGRVRRQKSAVFFLCVVHHPHLCGHIRICVVGVQIFIICCLCYCDTTTQASDYTVSEAHGILDTLYAGCDVQVDKGFFLENLVLNK